MKINQFHSGTAVGDAITNQMFLIQEVLRKNGYESEIYAEHIPKELSKKIKPIHTYNGGAGNVLFVHHSMGMDCFDKIINLKDKKIMIYHNITPEKFFDDEGTKKYIRLGLRQARDYKDYIDYCIAASNYNRRELIHMGHSCDIDVMPVQISLDRFDKVTATKKIIDQYADTRNFLFVGRVVWNKRQDDVIKAFAVYNRYYNPTSKLFIVGDDSMQGYIEELKNLASRLKIADSVVFTGKVPEEDLKAYYSIADIFLCMSEHEGFGVPLLEAMKMEVPVVAFRSSAIPETMGGAGVIVTEKNYAYIGALLNELITDQTIYNGIVEKQTERLERLKETDTEQIILSVLDKVEKKSRRRTIQMQGPFESSYSLAIVNRKLIEAMDDSGKADVSIYCTEGPGDYEPNPKDLKDKPHAKALWEKSKQVTYPDITIRNMYPPRVHDVNGGLNFLAFGWEESVIPANYIKNFNQHLSGIGTMSDYVTEKLIECGLKIPVKTMGIGVELAENFAELSPYKLKTKKKVRFLHISSAFPRKGVDVLLKGYYEAFTAEDDVCLVLKTFPNPHNNVAEILEELNASYDNPPEIEWINEDLSTDDLYSLYKASDCYVQTARGEGFGLPVAEAMLAKVPVIVSANSGMADFCNEKTALLVDYELTPAKTHLTTSDSGNISMWAEPDVDSLIMQLKKFAMGIDKKQLNDMIENAYTLIKTEFSWKKVAERWFDFIEEVENKQYKPKVAMVTTWNSKCGIAEYTKMEIEASMASVDYQVYPNYGVELLSKDEDYVQKRLWHSAFEGNMDALTDGLINSGNEIVHFQFNFGFFELKQLGNAVERIAKEKKVIITFHKTEDSEVAGKMVSLRSIVKQLNQCHALVVHQEKDKELLIQFGINKKIIKLIPLGQISYPEISSSVRKEEKKINSSLVIGSYGFLLPHKGIKEVIGAVAELKNTYPDVLYMPICALHDSQESKSYLKECIEEAERLGVKDNVRFTTDFLPNDDSMRYLQACDVMVMPYKPSMESASGAIRFCLASCRPIITTKQAIFDEFKDCTYQIEKTDKMQIANAIKILTDAEKKRKYVLAEKEQIKKTSWYTTVDKYYDVYCEVL